MTPLELKAIERAMHRLRCAAIALREAGQHTAANDADASAAELAEVLKGGAQ